MACLRQKVQNKNKKGGGPDLPPGAPGPGVRNGFWTLSPTKREESTGTLCFISRRGPRRGGGTRGTLSRSGSRALPRAVGEGRAGQPGGRPLPGSPHPAPAAFCPRGEEGPPPGGRTASWERLRRARLPARALVRERGCRHGHGTRESPCDAGSTPGPPLSQPPPDRETLEWHSGGEAGAQGLHSWPPTPVGHPLVQDKVGCTPGPTVPRAGPSGPTSEIPSALEKTKK